MSNHNRFTPGIMKKPTWNSKEHQVTPEPVFNARRNIIKAMGLGAIGASLPGNVQAGIFDLFGKKQAEPGFITHALTYNQNKIYTATEVLTPLEKVTRHNNFYEFGTAKHEPANNARQFKVDPWQLVIDGEVDNPIKLDLDDLTKLIALEERTYRLRCVEAWSMVVPWVGFPLAALLKKAGVKTTASHVAFETLFDPEQMPGQKNRLMGGGIHYPYVEGLTIKEAMNDLSFMAVGLYGKTLPPQNGAPIRLVVPWKYGFKSIKSIVRIRVMDKQPPTSWNQLASREYGFYANVNPEVSHPRWSQASERRITAGGLFSAERIPTQKFNGYGEYVAELYQGMDLRKNY